MVINEFLYPKPKRLPIGPRIKGKEYIAEKDLTWLFKSRLIVEEKMDGKQTYFETGKLILWCEDLQRKHSIKYRVPGRYALFNVFDRSMMQFLNRGQLLELWWDIKKGKAVIPGFEGPRMRPLIFPVPQVAIVKGVTPLQVASLIAPSVYAINKKNRDPAPMEGLVVKQDRTQFYFEFITGKIVREEFERGITTNYRDLPREDNIIDPSVPLVLDYPIPLGLSSPR